MIKTTEKRSTASLSSKSSYDLTAHPDIVNGCVSLSFDDGYAAVYNNAFDMFQRHNMVGTAYIATGSTDLVGYMKWSELKIMQSAGWKIGAHRITHPGFEKISLKKGYDEAIGSKDALEGHGFKVSAFAFPYGSDTKPDLAMLSQDFTVLRGFLDHDREVNDPMTLNSSLIHTRAVVTKTKISEVEKWIAQAKAQKQCVSLVFHELSDKEGRFGRD